MSQQINLFNPAFRKKKRQFSAVDMAQGLGLILAGSIALSAYAGYRSSSLGAQAAAAATQLITAQSQLALVNAANVPRQKNKTLEDDIQKSEAEVQLLQRAFDTLKRGEFGNTHGYAEYLRAFARQIPEGLWLTGLGIYGAGNEIGLQGRALQPDLVPAYIGRLKREPVMQGKSFATLEMQVPQVESAGKGDSAAARQRVPAAYVEFRLQSSGIANESATPSEAKVK